MISLSLPARGAEAVWLDQYNALIYLGTFRLDAEIKEMKSREIKTLLLHADALPSPISSFIAWRAKEVGRMDSIAWIQKPNHDNLKKGAALWGFKGLQIDDHYFNNPPISLGHLRRVLGNKELWCSFQPHQFSLSRASQCDQSDVQIYRESCRRTGDIAWNMGITGKQGIAVAAYTDGSRQGARLIECIKSDLSSMGTKLFVFKWKNQEVWSREIFRAFSHIKKMAN